MSETGKPRRFALAIEKDGAESLAPTLVLRPAGEESPEVLWMTTLAGTLEVRYP